MKKQERECGLKRQYRSRSTAKRARGHIETGKGGQRMDIYRCTYCRYYHLGHKKVGFYA